MRNPNRPLPWVTAVLILAAVAVAAGCGNKKAEEPAPVIRPVKTITVGGVASGEFLLPAIVEAGEKALLSFRVSGRLIELPVEEGQTVEKGDLIGRLDPVDFQIAVSEAEAVFSKAESDYKRYQQLYEKNAVPLAELEVRRSQRDVTKAKLDAVRDAGFQPMVLDPIDFNALYVQQLQAKRQQEMAAAQGDPAPGGNA